MYIQGTSNASEVIKANISDLISRLDTGDVLRARVLGRIAGEIELRLSDGSVLKAAINENTAAEAGSTLMLRVTSSSGSKLFLEIIKDNTGSGNCKPETIKSILESLRITYDKKSAMLAAEFLKSGVELSSEMFEKALNLMKAYKGIDAEKAVFLAANDILPDNIDVKLLKHLLEGNIKIGKHLDELLNYIKSIMPESDVPSELNTVSQGEFSADSKSEHLSGITSEKTESTGKTISIHSEAPIQNAYKAASSGKETGNQINELQKAVYNMESNDEVTDVTKSNDNTSDLTASIEKHNEGITGSDTPESANKSSSGASSVIGKPDASAAREIQDEAFTVSLDGSKQAPSEEMPEVPENFHKDFYAPVQSDRSAKGHFRPGFDEAFDNILKTINQIAEAGMDIEDNQISELKSVIEQLFIPLDRDKNAKELNIKKFQKEMGNKLDKLELLLHKMKNDSFPAADNISTAAASLEDAVKVLDKLSTSVHYYQLPVNLSGLNTTAEIYIMKDKNRKKRIDPGNTVLFVSLDTNRIGRIETLIYLNGKNASISLRAENEKILSFIKDNIKYLYNGLADSGYKLTDVKYSVNNEASSPVQIEKLLSQLAGSNYGRLDMRI